jgi:DNA-binding IclR family transcriptional regulator
MAHTFEELKSMTVAQLRELAKESDHEAVKGYSTMHKEQLLLAVCEALGVEAHAQHEVVGIDKSAIKKRIGELKTARDAALADGDPDALKLARRQIHDLKRKIRRATM